MNPSRGARFLLVLVLAAVSAGAYLVVSAVEAGPGFPLDDAWIHQTYARNLALRGEWSFLPGQVSGGSTSPLWTAALAIGHVLGLRPETWAAVLGIISLALTGYVCGLWLERRHPGRRWAWLCAGALTAFEWHLVWSALSGMETVWLVLLAAMLLAELERESPRPVVLGSLMGLGAWIRPDALSLLLPLLLAFTIRPPASLRGAGPILRTAGAAGFLIAAYLLFNRALSGEWWPTTFYAKPAEYAIQREVPFLERWFDQLRPLLAGAGGVLLAGVFLAAATAARAGAWRRIAPALWACAFLGLYAFRLPVTYQHGRYAMPVLPVLIVLGLDGMLGWIRTGGGTALRRSASRAWALALAMVAALFWGLGARAHAQDVAIIQTEMVAAARWVAANTESEAIVAAHDIGALGYFGERRLVDLAGLISPEVIPILRDEPALAEMLDARAADYLVTFPGWYPELVAQAAPVFSTGGAYAPAAGGENMVVYRWRGPGAP